MHRFSVSSFAFGVVLALSPLQAANQETPVWTDPKDKTLPASFKFQGEYSALGMGVQVIALGAEELQAVVYPGGLPGSGWNGQDKSLLTGRVRFGRVSLKPATGERSYLAADPAKFSATRKDLSEAVNHYSATIGNRGFNMTLHQGPGLTMRLRKKIRHSSTLSMRPPTNAMILFQGLNKNAFVGGRVDEKTRLLNTDGKDIRTESKFNNYHMHVEFLLPFRPDARGQGRANSGFYQADHYEVQILDSFGLDGLNNECGGVYTKAAPRLNMCLPPLVWQTYDVVFLNAIREGDTVVKPARLTLWHNGVLIHENLELDSKTGGSRPEPEGTPGPIKLQGHGNPLQFRNIWLVELD